MIKKCVVCENEFEPVNSSHICCSKKCNCIVQNNKAKEIRRERATGYKICKSCLMEFMPDRIDQVVCKRPKCKSRRDWHIRNRETYPEIECEWCGKKLIPRTAVQKTCGGLCSENRNHAKATENAKHRQSIAAAGVKFRSKKQQRIEAELEGKTFAQALAEKYGLTL